MKKYICISFLLIVVNSSGYCQQPDSKTLKAFADTLVARQIMGPATVATVYEKANKGELKNGALSFLPYLENAKAIDLSLHIRQNHDPEEYILSVFNDIASVVPGFKYSIPVVCNYQYGKSRCEKIMRNPGDETVIDETEKPFAAYTWQLSDKKNTAVITSNKCGECIDTETELVFIINKMLSEQKSRYQVSLLKPLSPATGTAADSVFGVIALLQEQTVHLNSYAGSGLYFNQNYSFYTAYLKKDAVAAWMNKIDAVKLLDHLPAEERQRAEQTLINVSYTSYNELLGVFPHTVYSFDFTGKTVDWSYKKVVAGLAAVSKNNFKPQNITVTDKKIIGNDGGAYTIPVLSFSLNGKAYRRQFEKYAYGFEGNALIDFINTAIASSGSKGRFYCLELTEAQQRQGDKTSFIYLTNEQYAVLEAAGVLFGTCNTISSK